MLRQEQHQARKVLTGVLILPSESRISLELWMHLERSPQGGISGNQESTVRQVLRPQNTSECIS